MQPAAGTYPDSQLTAFILFSNENLPLPKWPFDQLKRMMKIYVEATINEVKCVLPFLASDEIVAYGKWLDKRIQGGFDCIIYEGEYYPISDVHRIVEFYPPEAAMILEDPDPVMKNHKHKLSHRASAILQLGLNDLDDRLWSLDKRLEEGRWEDYSSSRD